jgi:hypothetical protein
MGRRPIQPGDTVEVRLSLRDRVLLLEHTVADPEYAERLQPTATGTEVVGRYTLEDLEDILGYVDAEANHTEDERLQRELDVLHDKLLAIQCAYDDGGWAGSGGLE